MCSIRSFLCAVLSVVVAVLKVGSSDGYCVREVLQVNKKFQGLLSSSTFSNVQGVFVLGVIKKVLEVIVFHSGFTQFCVCACVCVLAVSLSANHLLHTHQETSA